MTSRLANSKSTSRFSTRNRVGGVAVAVLTMAFAVGSVSTSGTAATTGSTAAAGKGSYASLRAIATDKTLRVVLTSPTGRLKETDSVVLRWLFDRPVGALTSVEGQLDPTPFATMVPPIAGAFRWASTRTLVFEPSAAVPLATAFTVTLAGIPALDGSVLTTPVVTSFETARPSCSIDAGPYPDGPTVVDSTSSLVRVRCTQNVTGQSLAAATTAMYRPVAVSVPRYTPTDDDLAVMRARNDAGASALASRLSAMATRAPVVAKVAFVEDVPCDPKVEDSPLCTVLRLEGRMPNDARASLSFGDGIVGSAGPLPLRPKTIRAAPTPRSGLVVTRGCRMGCDPDNGQGIAVVGATIDGPQLAGHIRVKNVATGVETMYPVEESTEILPEDVLSLQWAKFSPQSRYEITVDADLPTEDGATLGYDSVRVVSFGPRSTLTRIVPGELVVEPSTKALRAKVRNVTSIDIISRRITSDRLVATVRSFSGAAKAKPFRLSENGITTVAVNRAVDASGFQAIPIVSSATGTAKSESAGSSTDERGVFLVAVRPGAIVPGSRYNATGAPYVRIGTRSERRVGGVMGWQSAIVQRTDLGVTLKASRSNVLVAVTSISTGKALKGVKVLLYAEGAAAYWEGTTDATGVALGDPVPNLGCSSCDVVAVVEGKVDGVADVAYAQTRWRTWGDDYSYEFDESSASTAEKTERAERLALAAKLPKGSSITSSVFADRGVYRLGEKVHLKGVVRVRELEKLGAPPKSVTELPLTVDDPRGVRVLRRNVALSPSGSFDTVFTVPSGGSQGSYTIGVPGAYASFLVTSFRRPDFVVDMKAKDDVIRGDSLSATATAKYLFGAPVADGSVSWNVNISDSYFTPPVTVKGLEPSTFVWDYVCFYDASVPCAEDSPSELTGATLTERTDAGGVVNASGTLATQLTRHRALNVNFEAEVSDVSRQAFAARAATLVLPGEFSLGVRRTGPFPKVNSAFTAEIVAADRAGRLVGGQEVTATLLRWEWKNVTRVTSDGQRVTEGNWRSETVGTVPVTTADDKAAFVSFTPTKPGTYEIRATATDARKNGIEAGLVDYVVGPGQVSWEVTDEPTVQLVSNKDAYAVGDVAQILVKSPFVNATGLLTLERNGVIESRRFDVRSSATVVEVPITAEFTPNVYASVVLTKGRTAKLDRANGDPGAPAVLTGSVNLAVPPAAKALSVSVTADQLEYLPGATGEATVKVVGVDGKPARGEVTVWAVDEGVLRLTNYATPDLLSDFYRQVAQDISTSDSRMRLASIDDKSLEQDSKGDEAPAYAPAPGGGGGDAAASTNGVRSDFRILAAWSASVVVGDDGTASVPLKLPQSLTAYRLIAVAASGADRFGSSDSTLRISTPFQVRPALPRFAALGDTFEAGAVLQNLSGTTGPASLSIELPADSPLVVDGPSTITVPALATAPVEVRFTLRATKLGVASFLLAGQLGDGAVAGTKDRVAGQVPVLLTQRLDTVAASGQVDASASGAVAPAERIAVPKDAIAGVGGFTLSASSSNLAGLGQSVEQLVEYPYGCLEQRSSRTKVLLGLSSLEGRYELPGLAAATLRPRVQAELNLFSTYQTEFGGLSYWPGDDTSDVYLTARVLDLLLDARAAKYRTPPGMIKQLTTYLSEQVRGLTNGEREEGAGDIDTVRASVASVLARAGKPERGLVTALVKEVTDDDSMPYTERVALLDAMLAAGDTGSVPQDRYTDLLASVRLDGDEASVESPEDWYNSWFSYRGSGSVSATADLLGLVTKIDPKSPLVPQMSRWLLNHRVNGTWGDTYTNGSVLHAFTEVARTAEAVRPDISASLTAGAATLTKNFGPTSLDVAQSTAPLSALGTAPLSLGVKATGKGTLHWAAQLRYATPAESLKARSQGFSVERSYFPYRGADSILGRPTTTFKAGDLVTVELLVTSPDRRANVVVDDALPAGFEALDVSLASTATGSTEGTSDGDGSGTFNDGVMRATSAGIDHTEVRDDRVLLFATQLEPGTFRYTYTARATAPGRFVAAPVQAEEMYRSEVYGRSAATVVTVTAPTAK